MAQTVANLTKRIIAARLARARAEEKSAERRTHPRL
jgi:hypothetical protein